METTMRYLGFALLFFVSQPGIAEKIDPRTCRTIVDRDERLACFDRAYFGDEEKKVTDQSPTEQSRLKKNKRGEDVPSLSAEPQPIEGGVMTERRQSPQPSLESPQPSLESPQPSLESPQPSLESPQPLKSQKKSRSLFGLTEQAVIHGRIAKMSNKNQQRMAFKLDSGDIWVQSSPRNLPFKVGDQITIKSGRLGGFILRNQSGTTTRVVPAD